MARLLKRAPLVNYNVNKAIGKFLLGDVDEFCADRVPGKL